MLGEGALEDSADHPKNLFSIQLEQEISWEASHVGAHLRREGEADFATLDPR